MAIDLEKIRGAVAPAVARLGFELYDVELTGRGRAQVLRVSIDKTNGVTISDLTDVTHALDKLADELIVGPFELEVSSPGVERSLKRPEHYTAAIGETLSVKYSTGGATVRERGRLTAATDRGITMLVDTGDERTISYDAISAARTVFAWGNSPRPGSRKEPSNS